MLKVNLGWKCFKVQKGVGVDIMVGKWVKGGGGGW